MLMRIETGSVGTDLSVPGALQRELPLHVLQAATDPPPNYKSNQIYQKKKKKKLVKVNYGDKKISGIFRVCN